MSERASQARQRRGAERANDERLREEVVKMGDGDGWVYCAAGHRHWGRFGAAGLLLVDGHRSVLQHRAPWTHEGDTWGLPGGARNGDEDPVSTALREAGEEAEISAEMVRPIGWRVDDHGGWSYTSVAAQAQGPVDPHAANAESVDVRWWPNDKIGELPLHSGFAKSWPQLRSAPAPLTVIVDAANVVGARPDGWWRDRVGATLRLRSRLEWLARAGASSDDLPQKINVGSLDRLLPSIVLVVEGRARPAAEQQTDGAWWQQRVVGVAASGAGDDAIVAQARHRADSGEQIVVVSSDRGLRARLPANVSAVGSSWLLDRLAETDPAAIPPAP